MSLTISGIAASRTFSFKGAIIIKKDSLARHENETDNNISFEESAQNAIQKSLIFAYYYNPRVNTYSIWTKPEILKIEEGAIKHLEELYRSN